MVTNSIQNLRNQVPKTTELFEPCIDALVSLGGAATVAQIAGRVGELLNLPVAVQSVELENSERAVLSYRIAWALNGLKRFGVVAHGGGRQWKVTELLQQLPTKGRGNAIQKALSKKAKLARVMGDSLR